MLKSLLFAAALLAPVAVQAASPEEAYLASRDAAINKLATLTAAGESGEGLDKKVEAMAADLKKELAALLGPVQVKGLSASVKLNADTLLKDDMGYGALDALFYESADKKSSMMVTTAPLLSHWLAEHKTWWGEKFADMPQDPQAALKTDGFYTQAFQTDAAYVLYGEVPLTKPAGADFALALLTAQTQSEVPGQPDQLLVSVMKGGRFYVIDVPVAAKLGKQPACDKALAAANAKAEALRQKYDASEPKDEALFDQATKAEAEGGAAYARCYGEGARTRPAFAKLTVQATALVASLPAK